MLLDLGSVEFVRSGTASQQLGGLQQAATGAEVFSGPIAASLSGLQQAASGAETFSGTIVEAVSGLRQSATGAEVFSGAIAETLGGLRQSAAGAEIFSGSTAESLGGLRQSAAGAETFSGPIAQRLGAIRQSAGGLLGIFFSATVAQLLRQLTQIATGSEVFSGSSAQSVAPLRQSASGAESFSGTIDQQLGGLEQHATDALPEATAAFGGAVPIPFFGRGTHEAIAPAAFTYATVEPATPTTHCTERHPARAAAATLTPAPETSSWQAASPLLALDPATPATACTVDAFGPEFEIGLVDPTIAVELVAAPIDIQLELELGPALASVTATPDAAPQIYADRPPRDAARVARLSQRKATVEWRLRDRNLVLEQRKRVA